MAESASRRRVSLDFLKPLAKEVSRGRIELNVTLLDHLSFSDWTSGDFAKVSVTILFAKYLTETSTTYKNRAFVLRRPDDIHGSGDDI
jgi:hypothetical protein